MVGRGHGQRVQPVGVDLQRCQTTALEEEDQASGLVARLVEYGALPRGRIRRERGGGSRRGAELESSASTGATALRLDSEQLGLQLAVSSDRCNTGVDTCP